MSASPGQALLTPLYIGGELKITSTWGWAATVWGATAPITLTDTSKTSTKRIINFFTNMTFTPLS
ncbi:hypothetical protein NSQ29_09165 [Paenibacillus sp. FSL F4-0236]|uniref:hypothetical protein n=1 Tax=Paenibacillus sp. FSL F4-0236 TaxID=2954731 RepID=UPI0030F812AC